MSDANYYRQHLAAFAAGSISADGSTVLAFGCALTHFGTGHYGLLLDADHGLVDDESFIHVQPKGVSDQAPYTVVDTSNVRKDIYTFGSSNTLANVALEVALYRSLAKQS